MKTLVVVAAGAADRPLEDLAGRTPLEAAATPVLDRLVGEGRLGRLVPAPRGHRPEEGAFALGLFGLDALSYADVGATLDAAAFDVPVGPRDMALRLSLVSANERDIFDPTGGAVRAEEAVLLLESLEEALADPDLVFRAGNGPRNVLVWKGARDVHVKTTPPPEVAEKHIQACRPKGRGTGPLLEIVRRSPAILGAHDVNDLRRELGENAANLAWPWGPGIVVPLPDFTTRTGVLAHAVGVEANFVGAARLQGILVSRPAGATGGPDSNLRAKADAALAALEASDMVFVHAEAAASASHARDFMAKVKALERIDGYLVGPLAGAADERGDVRLVVLGGPATAVASGRDLADAVPLVIRGPGVRSTRSQRFAEAAARDAGFEVEHAHELLAFLLHLPA